MSTPAKLALEDGAVFAGTSIGAAGEVNGEVCFNTSMTGYQEILTDPSYRGQIVTMTYPQIGNYGVNAEDVESWRPQLAGFVVREHSRTQSNFRSEQSLGQYLKQWGVVAIESIDTRALVRRLRSGGAMKGILSTVDLDDASLVAKAKASPGLVGRDLVREVLPDQPRDWQEPLSEWTHLAGSKEQGAGSNDGSAPHVVALDFGMKWNIPRYLYDMGCRVTILPGTATAADVLAQQSDGVFLSNGPGDPEPLEYAIRKITLELASFWGLQGRGMIREGNFADLAIFDLETISPTMPTLEYDLPGGARRLKQKSVGIKATIVNGEVLMRNNEHTGALPGKLIRGPLAATA